MSENTPPPDNYSQNALTTEERAVKVKELLAEVKSVEQLQRELAAREEELAAALGRAYRAEVAIGPLAASIVSAQQRAEKAEAERDLAIAHDRQPYPTAHAYEQVCEALKAAKSERDAAVKNYESLVGLYSDLRAQLDAIDAKGER